MATARGYGSGGLRGGVGPGRGPGPGRWGLAALPLGAGHRGTPFPRPAPGGRSLGSSAPWSRGLCVLVGCGLGGRRRSPRGSALLRQRAGPAEGRRGAGGHRGVAEGAELRGAAESGRRGFVLHQRRRLEGLRFPRGSQLPGARGNGEQPAAGGARACRWGEVFLGRFAQKVALCAPRGLGELLCVPHEASRPAFCEKKIKRGSNK